jgi:hypothetical protein
MRFRAVLATALVAGIPLCASAEPDDATRATMRRVFDALAVLLPASADVDRFPDPAQRDALQLAFEELTGASRDLAAHGAPGDEAFRLFARSLATDADDAASRFARGRVGEAAFLVGRLTQRCATCHARLPAAREFPFAERLLGAVDLEQLEPTEQAQLFVATRRFGDALAMWERVFADPNLGPFEIEQSGAVLDYLTVAIRVERDLPRAERALTALARRSDTPRALQARLLHWTDGLRELAPAPLAISPLERAAILAARARNLAEFPFEHDGLALELYASGLLEQEVAKRAEGPKGLADPDLAEAFWLLALIDARTTPPLRLSQEEIYLEAAIRAAPAGPLARRAYARIEELMLVDYGSARTADLPEEGRTRLAGLRRILGEPEKESGPL